MGGDNKVSSKSNKNLQFPSLPSHPTWFRSASKWIWRATVELKGIRTQANLVFNEDIEGKSLIMGHWIFFFLYHIRIKDLVNIVTSHTYSLAINFNLLLLALLEKSSVLMPRHVTLARRGVFYDVFIVENFAPPTNLFLRFPLMEDCRVIWCKHLKNITFCTLLLYNMQLVHEILNIFHWFFFVSWVILHALKMF